MIGEEDLGRRVPQPEGDDEISRLAATMNGMLDRLQASVEKRQAFVADASHELRGPLTRMRSTV
jgi:signal transduction histidine kinase